MMSHRDTAIRFIERFCDGDVANLEPLLAADLKFNGPFHQFESREAYLAVLKDDPPERCEFQAVSVTESEDSVVVFYEYQKPDRPIMIAQLFRFRDEAISEIILVFDGRGFV